MKNKKLNISDPLARFRQKDPQIHPFPKSAQEAIDIVKVSENGIFELPGSRYSRSYRIKDINYKHANEEERDNILYTYATKVVNIVQNPFKLTFLNRKKDLQTMKAEYLYPDRNDEFHELRGYVNQEVLRRIQLSRKGFRQEKYITVSTQLNDLEDIELKFTGIDDDLKKGFMDLESDVEPLSGDERLQVLRRILQPSVEGNMPSIVTLSRKNRSFLDELMGMSGFDFSDKKRESFRCEKKHCAALQVVSFPDILSDGFMDALLNYPLESIISIDVVPVAAEAARKFIYGIYDSVEDKIRKQQKIRNKNKDYSSDISEPVKREKENVAEFMDQSRQSCEKMYLAGITIILMADSKSELTSAINGIQTIGERESVRIETAWMQQKESFMTALPIGNRYTENLRVMLSSDVATLCPFQSLVIQAEGKKISYGFDQISDELVFGNRNELTYGGGFRFGKPGNGKSFDAKWEMANIMVGSNDAVIVVDPTLEYANVTELFHGAFLDFSPSSGNHINPLDCKLDIFDSDSLEAFINDTGDYMLSVFSLMMPGELTSAHRTIISRCIRLLYTQIQKLPAEKRYVPIMSDLKAVFDEQEEPQAYDLSLALELYTTGSFSMFNHLTDVDIENRFMIFGMRDVGETLFGQAMLTIHRHISNQILKNHARGITTYVYYDEVHEVLKDPVSAKYLDNAWRKNRKLDAVDTGLTHTIEEITENPIAKAMVKNSEFFMVFKSSKDSAKSLVDSVEGMKKEHFRFVINTPVGCGLMRYGADIIPVDARVAEDNPLVRIFNTDPHKYKKKREGDGYAG